MPEGAETAEATQVETTEDAGTEQAPEGKAPTQADFDKMQAALKKANDEAARYRHEAKANADAATKIAEIEEAGKSETQKLTDRASRSEARVAELELELARERVARRHNLTDAQVTRLLGSNEEELEADALVLLETFQVRQEEEQEEEETNGHRQAPTTPRPTLKSGKVPSTNLNDDKLLEAIKRKVGAA